MATPEGAPLLADDGHDRPNTAPHGHGPGNHDNAYDAEDHHAHVRHSEQSPGRPDARIPASVWLLTFSAGISGLLFGCTSLPPATSNPHKPPRRPVVAYLPVTAGAKLT